MNIQKLAIIALPERVNDYVGLAVKAGFEPVNSISGYITPADIDQADYVYYPAGWSGNSYLLDLVNRSISSQKPVISSMQLGTGIKTINMNGGTILISYMTHCPHCLRSNIKEGTIHVSDDLQVITFNKFKCISCSRIFTPIHHIKHAIYAMDC
jgi:hypothetical protein